MADQSRVASFFSYPYPSEVSAFVLAEAGFSYEGNTDEVICHHCGLRYSGWQKGDDPKCIHLEKSPDCPFFITSESEAFAGIGIVGLSGAIGGADDTLSERTKNTRQPMRTSLQDKEDSSAAFTQVPKEETAFESKYDVPDNAAHTDETTLTTIHSDISNIKCEKEMEKQRAEGRTGTQDSVITTTHDEIQTVNQIDQDNRTNSTDAGQDSTHYSDTITLQTSPEPLETVPPKYQQFSVLATRLNSYRHWPQHLKQRPEVLAKAGLFYEGTNDYVRCFHCAGGLREWDPEDDPFYEHARWFPFCSFMRLVKGDKYIMGVQSGTIKPPDIKDNELKSEEIKDSNCFDHPAVVSVMLMGYSKPVLSEAIGIYRKCHGMSLSAEQLLPIVWEITENENRTIIPEEDNTGNEDTNDNVSETLSKSDKTDLTVSAENTTKGIQELQEENRELREKKCCKVCLDEEASIVFLPCGHLVTCPMCASAIRKCPVCRTCIRGTVKAIIS